MNYGDLLAADLEIGSGAVEGAIKNIIGVRFDKGGPICTLFHFPGSGNGFDDPA
jgi:hypothetical protein